MRITGALAWGGVIAVAALGAFIIVTSGPTQSAAAPRAVIAATAAATRLPTLTAAPPTGQWANQGSAYTPDFAVPEGTYDLVWNMSVVQPQPRDPLWTLHVRLYSREFQVATRATSVALAAHPTASFTPAPDINRDLVDWQQQPGQSGPFVNGAGLGHVPAGTYWLQVDTCQFCAWQLAIWRR